MAGIASSSMPKARSGGTASRAVHAWSVSTRAVRASASPLAAGSLASSRPSVAYRSQRRAVRCPLPERRDIRGRDGGQRRAAGGPVRNRELGAQRRREAVHRTQPGVREADAREKGRAGHACPGRRGAWAVRIRVPGEQAVAGRFETRQRERVRDRRRPERDVRLQQLRDRVHPVGRDPDGSHPRQQVRIHDGVRRHEPLVPERALVACRTAFADHGVAGGLGAGARGRRHGDERHRGAGVRHLAGQALQMVDDARPASQEPGHRLGRVEHAPAADPDHDLHGRGPVRLHDAVHEGGRRLVKHARLADQLDTGGREAHEQRIPSARGDQRPTAGHEQRAMSVTRRDRRYPLERARPEIDPRQAAKGERCRAAAAHPAAVSG